MDIVGTDCITNWPSGGSGLSATFATGYFNGSSNYVYWGHEDNMNKDDYAFMNSYHGYTYINAKATKDIRFRIDNNEKMILDPSGNLGIGTTTPSKLLHLYGGDNASNRADIVFDGNWSNGNAF